MHLKWDVKIIMGEADKVDLQDKFRIYFQEITLTNSEINREKGRFLALQETYEYFLIAWNTELRKFQNGYCSLSWLRRHCLGLFISACNQTGIDAKKIIKAAGKKSLIDED